MTHNFMGLTPFWRIRSYCQRREYGLRKALLWYLQFRVKIGEMQLVVNGRCTFGNAVSVTFSLYSFDLLQMRKNTATESYRKCPRQGFHAALNENSALYPSNSLTHYGRSSCELIEYHTLCSGLSFCHLRRH